MNLHSAWDVAASTFGDCVALMDGDDAWTYADLAALSRGFSAALVARGVGPGDRVAIMLPNRVEFGPIVAAVSRLGAAAALVSPAWKALEVRHALELTGVTRAVGDGDTLDDLVECLGADRVTNLDAVERSLASDAPAVPDDADVAVADDAEAVLVFSSGTTGLPKAVRHTHASIGHATDHWVASLGLGSDDRFQVATPPSHILGLLNILAAARAGATVRIHRRFDLDALLTCIESDRMTLEMAVAPIALAIAAHPRLEEFDLSSLRYIMWGATPVTASVAERVTARTGVRWLPAYGASEVPVIAANPVDRPDEWRLDSAGIAPAGVELRVVDLETGEVVEPGAGALREGEIQVRSASAMAGYLPDEANADAFVDGWFRTGDVGWIEPDGWVHLTDRVKEMIKVNGFQVAPAEVEGVLLSHPAVLDCAVFGLADERAGEVPVGVVQLDPTVAVADGELEALVAGSLATYKHLRHLVVVDSIPRLPSGKALRRVLRDEIGPTLAAPST